MVYDGNKTQPSHNLSFLGVLNALAVFLLVAALLFVFAGWPLMSHFREDPNRYNQGTNNTGQVPTLSLGSYGGMIDDDTPQSARTIRGMDGDEYHLVFSDEFERGLLLLRVAPERLLRRSLQRRAGPLALVMIHTGASASFASFKNTCLSLVGAGRQSRSTMAPPKTWSTVC